MSLFGEFCGQEVAPSFLCLIGDRNLGFESENMVNQGGDSREERKATGGNCSAY